MSKPMEVKPPTVSTLPARPHSHAELVAATPVRIKVPLKVVDGRMEPKYVEEMGLTSQHNYKTGTGLVELNVDQATADKLLYVDPKTRKATFQDVSKVG